MLVTGNAVAARERGVSAVTLTLGVPAGLRTDAPWLLGGLVWIVAFGTVASAAAYAWKGVHAP